MSDTKPTVLIVDDEPAVRESFSLILESEYNLLLSATGEDAIRKAAAQKVDLVFLDIRMPGLDGIETLRRLKKISPNLEVVMVTAVYDVERAAEAIKIGALDYMVKPFEVETIVKFARDVITKKDLLKAAGFEEEAPHLVGEGEKTRLILEKIKEVAAKDSWALIVAEDGSEKETVAAAIHYIKKGSSFGFRIVEALSITEEEFFGTAASEGLILDNQTIFIDHIEKLTPEFQQKLLQVGGVRIIGGTPHNLKKGALYERLCADIISLAPLRERAGDVVELLEYYRLFYNELYGTKAGLFSDEAIGILSLHSWPGNITELKSLVSTAVLNQREGEIAVSSLPLYVLMHPSNLKPQPFEDIYAEFEKDFIKSVLKKADSNLQKAEKLLGINPHVLESKI